MNKRGYSKDEVTKEIAAREPDFLKYIAPQKEFADAVIGIDYSEYGRQLGVERNVYRITLSQNRRRHSIENIDLSLNLYSILSLSQRNFSLKFLTSVHDGHKRGELVIDGELSEHVVNKLERSIERQTGVHPISIVKDKDYVTAGDLPADPLLAYNPPAHLHGDEPVTGLFLPREIKKSIYPGGQGNMRIHEKGRIPVCPA